MLSYQRETVALIVQSGARVAVLPNYRLVELWSEYSARQFACIWVQGERDEVRRFVRWTAGQRKLEAELKRYGQSRKRESVRVPSFWVS